MRLKHVSFIGLLLTAPDLAAERVAPAKVLEHVDPVDRRLESEYLEPVADREGVGAGEGGHVVGGAAAAAVGRRD